MIKKFRWQYLILAVILNEIYGLPMKVVKNRANLFSSIKRISTYRLVFSLANWSITVLSFLILLVICQKYGLFGSLNSFFSYRQILFLIFFCLFVVIFSALVMSLFFKTSYAVGHAEFLYHYAILIPKKLFLFQTIFTGPVFEEVIYRVCLFQFLNNDKVAAVVSILLFAYLHTGFSVSIVIYLPTSLAFTYAYTRRKQVLDSAIVHSVCNFTVNDAVFWVSHVLGI
jgi:membrane protease YdiL (CAAX protease family)